MSGSEFDNSRTRTMVSVHWEFVVMDLPSGVIKHGWTILKLNGGFPRNPCLMTPDTGG